MDERCAGDRIGSFCVGAAIAALAAFLAWGSFALLTAMMPPALSDSDYWTAVRERAESNPTVTAVFVLCCVAALAGTALMVRAVLGQSRQHTASSASNDSAA